jgi:lycopene cyclase domain-containing protein
MLTGMTYSQFLLFFVVLPSAAMLVYLLWRGRIDRRWWAALGATCVLAVVYTTPWDNVLVANNVWSYPPERVWGIVLGYVPLEEYMFFVLETVMIALIVRLFTPMVGGKVKPVRQPGPERGESRHG